MTTILIVCGALVLGGVVGAFLAWRPLNNALSVARTERRAAQRELAGRIAYLDRFITARDKEKAADDREYNDLWAHAEALAAELDRAYATMTNQAELIRERGMHDAAVAEAHEAVLVEPTGALPLLRGVTGVTTDYTPVDFDAWWAALDVGAKALPAGSVAA